MYVLPRRDPSIVDIPENCVFNVDIIRNALSHHNIDTSLLTVSFVSRKLSIGLLALVNIIDIITLILCNILQS